MFNCYNSFDFVSFRKCLRILTNQAFSLYSTALVVNLYKSGIRKVHFYIKIVQNGHIKRLTDQDIQSSVLEIMGTNVTTSFITCPANEKETLGIKLPFLVMIIKNVHSLLIIVEKILHVLSPSIR